MSWPSAMSMLETELQGQTAALSGSLLETCRYALQGGRRLRAALILGAVGQGNNDAVQAAAAIEMMHAATLLQDDIFDQGDVRRGRAAAHVRFGKASAVLASDWLLVRSLEIAAELDVRFFRSLARTARSMVQAEAQELTPPVLYSFAQARRYGSRIAQGKTAALFGCCLYAAALLQRMDEAQQRRWSRLGRAMGATYQLVDDCLDLYGCEANVRKSVGHDLPSGCLTLPVLLAAQGTALPLHEIQANQLGPGQRACVQEALASAEVQGRVRGIILRRLTRHCREAAGVAGLELAIRAFAADLTASVDLCFSHGEDCLPIGEASSVRSGESFPVETNPQFTGA